MKALKSDQPPFKHGSRYASALVRLRLEGARGPGGRLDVTKADVVALLELGFGKAQVARALEISKSTLRRRLREDDGASLLTFRRLEG